jgi:hypothetical protein
MPVNIQGPRGAPNVATITITIPDNSKLADLCKGLDWERFQENPPTDVATAEAFIKAVTIERYKLAYKRGNKRTYDESYVEGDLGQPAS